MEKKRDFLFIEVIFIISVDLIHFKKLNFTSIFFKFCCDGILFWFKKIQLSCI